jgi:hypothetical protein
MRPVNNVYGGSVGRSRLLEKLLRDSGRANNGTTAGGLAHMLQSGMAGYLQGQERQAEQKAVADEGAAMAAMNRGMSAQQWQPPEGEALYAGAGPDAPQISREQFMEQQPEAGGYGGAITALQGLGADNQAAGRLTSQLTMKKMDRDQSRADLMDERQYETGIREEERANELRMNELRYKQQLGLLGAREASELRVLERRAEMEAAKPPKPVGQPYEVLDEQTNKPILIQGYSDGSSQPVNGYGPVPPRPRPGVDAPYSPEVKADKLELARAQGEASAALRPLTQDETKAGGFAVRMENATGNMNSVLAGPDGKVGTKDDYDPSAYLDAMARGVPFVGNSLQSKEGQQFQQAASDWVSANLRKESGAALGKDETRDEIVKYFPQPGDSPEVMAQKARSRELAEAGMITAAGRAYDDISNRIKSSDKNNGWSIKKVQ